MHAELRHRGVRVARKRVARLMRAAGLCGCVPAPARHDHDPRARRARRRPTSCARDFGPPAPNALWVADITQMATWEGPLYLAVVLDCFSRRVVGWAMAEHMRAELVVEALEMAVGQRKPARRPRPPFGPGLAVHRRSSSASAAARPASPSPWAPAAARSTTPSARASSRR